MPQSSCKYFKVQGRNVNLHLRIELVGSANRSSEELAGISEPNVDDGDSSRRQGGLHDRAQRETASDREELLGAGKVIPKIQTSLAGGKILSRGAGRVRTTWNQYLLSPSDPMGCPFSSSKKTYCKLGFCMSPIAHVDNVRAPVLLLIGEDDLRAVPAQGLRFYDALKGREKRVEMLWFKGRHIRLMVLRRQGFRGRLGGIGLRI
ncbi:hypothetical protein C8R48DRAFT_793951 [Suillus tomentosus]|nr:hypothetical protein C8R48DRAFT_793951 [Suillus tomentosus]